MAMSFVAKSSPLTVLQLLCSLFPFPTNCHSFSMEFIKCGLFFVNLFLETLNNYAQRKNSAKQHATHLLNFDSLSSSQHSLFCKSLDSFNWADISLVTPVMFFHKSFISSMFLDQFVHFKTWLFC